MFQEGQHLVQLVHEVEVIADRLAGIVALQAVVVAALARSM